jgi:transcriptional regulator with XRE-family HTH domain
MGRRSRRRPERIGAKLRQIRNALGLSQNQMTHHLRLPKEFKRGIISNYENDEREPPLFVLLAYARVAGICLEVIVDDAIDVPTKLPVTPAHRAIEISPTKRTVR